MTMDETRQKKGFVTAKMLRFLSHRLLYETDVETCKETGIAPSSINRWKSESEAFKREYDLLFTDGVKVAKKRCKGLLGKAVDVVTDCMGDHRSPALQLKAAELVFKTNGLLGDKLEHDVSERLGGLLEKLVAAGATSASESAE